MAKDNDIELTFEEQETDIQESALSEQPENGQQPLAMEKDIDAARLRGVPLHPLHAHPRTRLRREGGRGCG